MSDNIGEVIDALKWAGWNIKINRDDDSSTTPQTTNDPKKVSFIYNGYIALPNDIDEYVNDIV